MGIVFFVTYKCNSCGYEYTGQDGIFETDPCDFNTMHTIAPMYCPKCGNIKDIVRHGALLVSKEKLKTLNVQNDSTICENCQTEFIQLDEKNPNICPKCGKKEFVFINRDEFYMT